MNNEISSLGDLTGKNTPYKRRLNRNKNKGRRKCPNCPTILRQGARGPYCGVCTEKMVNKPKHKGERFKVFSFNKILGGKK